ncbi:hypothetical protein M422DRAFT_780798 [Sphaerobolus stellatus SS14]|uniref:Uncharacterized protein n=1 Tax=Sphaerobolus stellatus (strain SS14) TaxID=990650 RepID=A0A0C9VPL3_SPHS4|nr:hypothetical protein M422DRAFT_780798 [Sphaerobolus stellatus SS14]
MALGSATVLSSLSSVLLDTATRLATQLERSTLMVSNLILTQTCGFFLPPNIAGFGALSSSLGAGYGSFGLVLWEQGSSGRRAIALVARWPGAAKPALIPH